VFLNAIHSFWQFVELTKDWSCTNCSHVCVEMQTSRCVLTQLVLIVLISFCTNALASVHSTPFMRTRSRPVSVVAAAPVAGWYAASDSHTQRIELYDIMGRVKRSISFQDVNSAGLVRGNDNVMVSNRLTFSASGRTLFISLRTSSEDSIVAYDTSTEVLSLVASTDRTGETEVGWVGDGGQPVPLPLAHHRRFLYVGSAEGIITVFPASSAGFNSTHVAVWKIPGSKIRALAVDRDTGTMFAATDSGIHRALLPDCPEAAPAPAFALLARSEQVCALTWAQTYGSERQGGLYFLQKARAMDDAHVSFISAADVAEATSSNAVITASVYLAAAGEGWVDITGTADGRLLVAAASGAVLLHDSSDKRLSYDAWMHDELLQVTAFARGLILPSTGRDAPGGWVLDGQVVPESNNLNPATPDAAAWTIFLLMMNERMNGDAGALESIRSVMTRYAGLAADGVKPARNADGIFKHWLDPDTGDTFGQWPDEYATLSTMKMVVAAARAVVRYPADVAIVAAASEIISKVKNWDTYLQMGSDAMAFKGAAAGGPDPSSWAIPFHEGIMFVEAAGMYGGKNASSISDAWFRRSLWPTVEYVPKKPLTVQHNSIFQPAFISLYPALLSAPYRADKSAEGWRTQVDNLRWSSAAWTDDNGARYYTVFAAGTSPIGYSADTLSNHPGNITTFPSLLALSAFGELAEAVGGYAAYRSGARQTFKGGGQRPLSSPRRRHTVRARFCGVARLGVGGARSLRVDASGFY